MSSEHMIPDDVREIVVALCKDYPRRRTAIECHTALPRTENEYKYYNYKIFNAVSEIIGEKNAEKMISDIGSRRGYFNSEYEVYNEEAFKYRKRLAICNIAKALHLV